MSWSDDRWLGAAPSIGMRITCSATRSASCSYSSPGSLMRNFACADMPINFFFSHSSQVPDNPLDPAAGAGPLQEARVASDTGLGSGSLVNGLCSHGRLRNVLHSTVSA
jgi:hypothetical protein